jgi:thiamine pyrophosphokinase
LHCLDKAYYKVYHKKWSLAMISKRCYIMGAGEASGLQSLTDDDYIIAADGGYVELASRGIIPNVVVGDFDSLSTIPEHPNIIRAMSEKDDTDMMLAVRHGLERGCKEFLLDGSLGGERFDHTFANIQTLLFLVNNNARGFLLGKNLCITAIKNDSLNFLPTAHGTVSVFSAGDKAEGVTITGLKYELDNASLTNTQPIGVSNEFTNNPATINVRNGILLVMWFGGIEFIERG